MPHPHIKQNKKTKWNEEVTAISYCKTTTIKKTSTKTHENHHSMCSPPLESHLTGQGRQQGCRPWDTTPLNIQFWNAITRERTSLYMLEFHDKYIQISLWQFGMHSCIHGLILCWLPWSMLQYISRLSWKWGGIYVRMSYWFISQVVSSKRIYNDGCDDTKLTVSSAYILRCHKSTSQPSGLIRPP